MTKKKAVLVRMEGGVFVARLEGSKYVYFVPRKLDGYNGETNSELERQGYVMGSNLEVTLRDNVLAGEGEVDSVRLSR